METTTQISLVHHLSNTGASNLITNKSLLENFQDFFEQAEEWNTKAKGLVVTSIEQKEEMKQAEIARKALKNIRVSVEHKRKELKEESLRTGQSIDAIAKIITNLILPTEEHLEKQEKFIQIQEEKRKADLKAERTEKLSPYEVHCEFYDLANMPEDVFQNLLNNSIIAFDRKQEEMRVAEAEAIAKKKAEAEEREKIRLENEKLKSEAEERERVAAEERKRHEEELRKQQEEARIEREKSEAESRKLIAEQEAKAKAEREEREKISAQLKAKEEAEAKAKLEAEAKAEAELSRGDKEKFDALIQDLEDLKLKYSFKSKKYKTLQASVNELLDRTINYSLSKI